MILLIDNYDSFVYNLARYVSEIGLKTDVRRNNQLSLEDVRKLNPSHIILSPGPCTPNEAGICLEVIREFGPEKPILGVCLGHQAIGQAYGGKVTRSKNPMHGRVSHITHNEKMIFSGLDNPLPVARYHSLIVNEENFPNVLKITARCPAGEIMAISHVDYPVVGVQFHPESILTQSGYELLENFFKS